MKKLESQSSLRSLDFDSNESFTSYTSKSSHVPADPSGQYRHISIRGQNEVKWSKGLAFIVLFLAASAVATTTYFLIIDEEQAEFRSQFKGFASEIVTVARQKADQIFITMEALSITIASSAVATNSSWPYVTVPNWSLKMNAIGALVGGEAPIIGFAPLVEEYQRDPWTAYAIQEEPEWYDEAIRTLGLNYTVDMLVDKTIPFIHYYDFQNNFMPTAVKGSAPAFPGWQVYPLRIGFADVMYTKYDYLQVPTLSRLIQVTNSTRVPSMGFDIDRREASNSIIQPIFEISDLKSQDLKMVGVVWVTLQWIDYLQNLLVEGVDGIVVVLRSSCPIIYVGDQINGVPTGDSRLGVVSYLINGPKAEYLGDFDAHDPQYNDLKFTKELVNLNIDESKIPEGNCVPTLTLDLYPTEDFENKYLSTKAIFYTVSVILIFGFTSLVFLLYDHFVAKRQWKVMDRIMKQEKIVSNVFPTAIRERLYEGQKGDGDILDPFDFEGQSSNLTEAPLADLFPETSVMFADIAGFTAWSSTREPQQVFILLETIYGAFDKLAYRYGVFKVETVGDCYVAVGGLPEPSEEHAAIVGRFARGCMKKMKEVTTKLDMSLGPDTSDLGLRIGIHSGQVTAGVLRGERSRFQLFGDTMNTAARMESSGNTNYIQLSETTAKLLIEDGWSNMIRPRRNKIQVKGKGEMQTYWLRTGHVYMNEKKRLGKSPRSHETLSTIIDVSVKSGDEDNHVIPDTSKQERLIEWTVEIMSSLLQQVMSSRNVDATDRDTITVRERIIGNDQRVLDEVVPIIKLKRFDCDELKKRKETSHLINMGEQGTTQLREFITNVARMYRENPFHNFQHATHVTASVKKLLTRIVNTDKSSNALVRQKSMQTMNLVDLAGHSYGITSDPLTQFAVVFSAIIHDIDHPGVTNAQLVKENTRTAQLYRKSIAEQNSVDLAWEMLMGPEYETLRGCIYQTEEELCRFRQLVVNSVMATDIVDKELQALRKARWETAFADTESGANDDHVNSEDRKATIVIEHLIQASDVSHTMQHWHIYKQWNEKFFMECYGAYEDGRVDTDPSTGWYEGEIGFFDFYVIPLAKKLDSCGVFGVCSHEYLNYALANRDEWVREGEKLVEEYLEKSLSASWRGGRPEQSNRETTLPHHQ